MTINDHAATDNNRRRPRFKDIAALAGVSVPTVDRVLNDRGNVRPATASRVIDAARQLRLNRILPVTPSRVLQYEALLVRPDQPFFERLNGALMRSANAHGSGLVVHRTFVEEFNARELSKRIAQAGAERDGLIVYSIDDRTVTAAIRGAARRGLPVIALVTDLGRGRQITYVGIDNYRAGRTAAFFIGRFLRRRGRVLVLCGSLAYRAQRQRVSGFQDALKERFPELATAPVMQGHDRQDETHNLIVSALQSRKDIVAIYNAGGMNRSVASAIRAAALTADLTFVGHGLTSTAVKLLRNGTMDLLIDQNPEAQARRALEILLYRSGRLASKPEFGYVPFSTYVSESLPD